MSYSWARKELSKAGLTKEQPTAPPSETPVAPEEGVAVLKDAVQEVNAFFKLPPEEQERRASVLVSKLADAGHQRILESFLLTPNDMMTASPSELRETMILTLKGYHDAYAFDQGGMLGGYTDPKIYSKVRRYLIDLSYLTRADKDLAEPRSHYTMIPLHMTHLRTLYAQYGAESNQSIRDRIQLETVILNLALEITPIVLHQIGVMMTLIAQKRGSYGGEFNRTVRPFAPQRFEVK